MPNINENNKLSVQSILQSNLFGPSIRRSISNKSQSNDAEEYVKTDSKKLLSTWSNPSQKRKLSVQSSEEISNKSSSSGTNYDYLSYIYTKPERKTSLVEKYNEKLIKTKTESIEELDNLVQKDSKIEDIEIKAEHSSTSSSSSLRKNFYSKSRSKSLQVSTESQDPYEANGLKINLDEEPRVKRFLSESSKDQYQGQIKTINEIIYDCENESITSNANSSKATTNSIFEMDIDAQNHIKENEVSFFFFF